MSTTVSLKRRQFTGSTVQNKSTKKTLSVVDSVPDVALSGSVEVFEENLELFGGLVREQTEQFLVLSSVGRLRLDLVEVPPVDDSVAV